MDTAEKHTYFKNKILSSKNLPTLPAVLQEALAIVDGKKVSLAQVASIVGRDQVFTTKVLKMVNSSLYGFPGRIASIQNAMALLGLNVVKGLIISTVATDYMLKQQVSLHDHSFSCSIAAREIAQVLRLPCSADLITASLLHDFGKVIIVSQLPEQYEEIVATMRADGLCCYDAEKKVLGFSHTIVGSWLAKLWHLPPNLTMAMQCHHSPMKAEEHVTMVSGVHLADFFAHLYGRTPVGEDSITRLDGMALKHLGVTQNVLEYLLDKLAENLLLKTSTR